MHRYERKQKTTLINTFKDRNQGPPRVISNIDISCHPCTALKSSRRINNATSSLQSPNLSNCL